MFRKMSMLVLKSAPPFCYIYKQLVFVKKIKVYFKQFTMFVGTLFTHMMEGRQLFHVDFFVYS